MKERLIQLFHSVSVDDQDSERGFSRLPIDLVAVTGFVLIAAGLLAFGTVTAPLARAAIGLPLLFFVPGYATVSALFPQSSTASETRSNLLITQVCTVTNTERMALAFGLSFGLIPLLGLGIALAPVTFTTAAVVAAVSGYTLLVVWIASVRRVRIPSADRYRLSVGRKLVATYRGMFNTESVAHTAVNVTLAVSVLLALTTVGYAFASPQQGEAYTNVQILTENESGELDAADYPQTIESGESIPLTIAVENQEGQDMDYTVVVQEQWVADGEVLERTELQRIDYSLRDGSTGYGERSLSPEAEEGTVRVSILLYEDAVPDTPTHDNAYRSTYFTTEITE